MKPVRYILIMSIFSVLFACASDAQDTGDDIIYVPEYESFTQMAGLPVVDLPHRQAWRQAAPGVEMIEIPGRDGEPDQPALWYHSGADGEKPLLLLLHSWSENYLQHWGIPYGAFAEKNDWILMAPDFRGRFNNPDATGSEKAVRDVLDALSYAKENAPVDNDRIYLAGFSGGAMMSLLMAGRYPQEFTAAAAWVPVYDLNQWYISLSNFGTDYAADYMNDIRASCGGNPRTDEDAREECRKRSPSAYLENAGEAGIKVFIGGGIHDHFVPPSQAIRAFNDLADEESRISEADIQHIDETETLPEGLKGQAEDNRFMTDAGLPVIFSRTASNATLMLFEGGHNQIYNAGFEWLARQRR